MKKMQLVEMTLLLTLPICLTAISLGYSNLLTMNLYYLFVGVMFGVGFVFPLSVLLYARRYSKKAFYNPLIRMVEIHIGRNGSPMKLARIVGESLRLAKQLNKNILFYTNHFPEERLREKFGDNLIIKNANGLQYVLFYLPFLLLTFGKRKQKIHPLLRCEILYGNTNLYRDR